MPRMCVQCGKTMLDENGDPVMDQYLCSDECRKKDRREKLALKRKRQKEKNTPCSRCKKIAQPLLVDLGAKTVTLLTPEEALRLAAKQPEILVRFSLQPPEDYDPDRPALTGPLASVTTIPRGARSRASKD